MDPIDDCASALDFSYGPGKCQDCGVKLNRRDGEDRCRSCLGWDKPIEPATPRPLHPDLDPYDCDRY